MDIGPYRFVHVCRIEPDRDVDGAVRSLMPQALFLNSRSLPLSKYGNGPFCKFRVPNTYKVSGVYAIQVDRTITYIGECANLSSRYNSGYGNISPRNCYKGGQDTNCRLNNLIYSAASEGCKIDLWFHQTNNYKIVELELLALQKWLWNRK